MCPQETPPKNSATRLDSLDALRGFDLLALTMLGPVAHIVFGNQPNGVWYAAMWTHVPWSGFLAWDLVMPLFMFMAGVSIPFALSKYVGENATRPHSQALLRIARRFILLWLLGCVAQGNLLSFDLSAFKPLSNTLQSIALGYAGTATLFLFARDWKKLIAVAGALLFISWLFCFLLGDWNPNTNLPEKIDRLILGKWMDGASLAKDGSVKFAPWYHYAWIFPTLNFIVTVLTGTLVGILLKNRTHSHFFNFGVLAVAGAGMVIAGWTFHALGVAPVIKPLWTSSMVLVSSGYCFLLMALFYGVIDGLGWKRGTGWLKIIGMNSILAYMLSAEVGLVNFNGISRPLLRGILQVFEIARPEIFFTAGNAVILFLILWLCFRAKVFLKA